METAASVAGLVSITALVKTSMDLWEFTTNIIRVSEDLDEFITRLETQYMRFFVWCTITGYLDLTNRAGETDPPRLKPSDSELLAPNLAAQLIAENVAKIMKSIHFRLQKAKELLKDYEVRPAGSIRSHLLPHGRHKDTMALSSISKMSRETMKDERRPWRFTLMKGPKWAFAGKSNAAEIIESLTAHNDGLVAILDIVDKGLARRLGRWIDCSTAATPMSRVMMTSYEGQSPSGRSLPNGVESRLLRISQISARGPMIYSLGEDAEQRAVPLPTRANVVEPRGISTSSLGFEIDAREISVLPPSTYSPATERQIGTYRAEQILVEWRYYSSRLSDEGRDLLEHRIHALAMQLHQAGSVPQFQVNYFMGYFHDTPAKRFGLVFQVPSGTVPKSLRDYLYEDYKNGQKRELSSRLELAKKLVLALFHLFSVGWLHKNMRPSNILFFEPKPKPRSLTEPHLFGFGFARRETAKSTTEYFPSVQHDLSKDREWRLYCHPDRDRSLSQPSSSSGDATVYQARSTMHFDAYALGIMLLEIAFWTPAIKICSSKETVEQFQESIKQKWDGKLMFYMGEGYAKVVSRLLRSDFGMDPTESHGDEREAFLGAFERTIVTEMDAL